MKTIAAHWQLIVRLQLWFPMPWWECVALGADPGPDNLVSIQDWCVWDSLLCAGTTHQTDQITRSLVLDIHANNSLSCSIRKKHTWCMRRCFQSWEWGLPHQFGQHHRPYTHLGSTLYWSGFADLSSPWCDLLFPETAVASLYLACSQTP